MVISTWFTLTLSRECPRIHSVWTGYLFHILGHGASSKPPFWFGYSTFSIFLDVVAVPNHPFGPVKVDVRASDILLVPDHHFGEAVEPTTTPASPLPLSAARLSG